MLADSYPYRPDGQRRLRMPVSEITLAGLQPEAVNFGFRVTDSSNTLQVYGEPRLDRISNFGRNLQSVDSWTLSRTKRPRWPDVKRMLSACSTTSNVVDLRGSAVNTHRKADSCNSPLQERTSTAPPRMRMIAALEMRS
jgi:hypothetical protein